jgi:hypothetical protein
MIYVEQYLQGSLVAAPDNVTLPKLGARLAVIFQSPIDPDRSGLYVVSANAGFQSSLLFWTEARRSGPAFANPELFPWTLANAAGGWLACHFGITGPNATYTGQIEGLLAAFEQAREDLTGWRIHTAWVVAVDFAQTPAQRTHFGVLRLSLRPTEVRIEPMLKAVNRRGRLPRASAALFKMFAALQQGQTTVLSDEGTAWVITHKKIASYEDSWQRRSSSARMRTPERR